MFQGLVGDSLTKNTSSKITLHPFLKPLLDLSQHIFKEGDKFRK